MEETRRALYKAHLLSQVGSIDDLSPESLGPEDRGRKICGLDAMRPQGQNMSQRGPRPGLLQLAFRPFRTREYSRGPRSAINELLETIQNVSNQNPFDVKGKIQEWSLCLRWSLSPLGDCNSSLREPLLWFQSVERIHRLIWQIVP